MALNFSEAMASIHQRGKEVGELADRGDDLARRTIMYYRQAWADYHKAKGDESLLDATLKANLIAAATEYLHRDMTVSDLADLQTKFGHRLPPHKRN